MIVQVYRVNVFITLRLIGREMDEMIVGMCSHLHTKWFTVTIIIIHLYYFVFDKLKWNGNIATWKCGLLVFLSAWVYTKIYNTIEIFQCKCTWHGDETPSLFWDATNLSTRPNSIRCPPPRRLAPHTHAHWRGSENHTSWSCCCCCWVRACSCLDLASHHLEGHIMPPPPIDLSSYGSCRDEF